MTVIFLIAQTSFATAAVREIIRPPQFKEAFDRAIFVGKVEVISKDEHPDLTDDQKKILGKASVFTLKPIQSYKNSYDKNLEILQYCCYSGQRDMPPVGAVYEEMIWERNGSYIRAPQAPEEAWALWRTTALPSLLIDEDKKKDCAEKSGEWIIENLKFYSIGSCRFPTKDGGKSCTDSSQCERFCFADLPENVWPTVNSDQTGKCGKWKNAQGCFRFVESGIVGDGQCIGQGYYK